ncbi:MAG: AAA family ATPase, partial [Planctomycetes bacterium]|nr:AAA family ATPase [Planctomycetota bacterium]
MKLTEIQIDRCGVWRNLTLPVKSQGISLFYGPNEAGKSTLRQFIRGVLFGFSGSETDPAGFSFERQQAAGSLHLEDAAGSHRIHRASGGDLAGDARLITGDFATQAHHDLLGGETYEQLFDRIFALNLRELGEVNSLSGDDVSRHVFGLSFGPRGQRLLHAARQIDEQRAALLDLQYQRGEMVELLERHDRLSGRLGELSELRARHSEWCLRRDQLEREIADLRDRHAQTSAQLRGHTFLERAWGPWNRSRECRQELETLSEISSFPNRGLERLDRIEHELATAAERRDRLRTEIRQLREELANPGGAAAWRLHAPAMRGFVEQRSWLAALEERRETAQQELEDQETELEDACERLGADWSTPRLEAADVTPAAERRLIGTAESFRQAQQRRQAHDRQCRRLKRACRELRDALTESLHDLEGSSVEAALEQGRARLASLHKLTSIQLRERELSHQLHGLENERHRTAPQLSLPGWVHVILGVFSFMGVILAGWGLVAGVATSGIAGAIYAMLGITTGGLAWGLKTQYESEARKRLVEVDQALAGVAADLSALRSTIDSAHVGKSLEETAQLVEDAQEELAELTALGARQQRLQGLRRKLARARRKRQTAILEVGTARHSWNELLQKIGITSSISIDDALQRWQELVAATETLRAADQARRELSLVESILDGYRQRIIDLARRLPHAGRQSPNSLEILADWEEQLATLDRGRNSRHELQAKLRHKRREAADASSRVAEIKIKRDALLVQGGAASRDEFEQRARSFARRTLLHDQRDDADRDLEAICASHTDLALVEADLEQFDARANSDQLVRLKT